jgi:hypothetical protein
MTARSHRDERPGQVDKRPGFCDIGAVTSDRGGREALRGDADSGEFVAFVLIEGPLRSRP